MAERRMFAKTIIDSDAFLDMKIIRDYEKLVTLSKPLKKHLALVVRFGPSGVNKIFQIKKKISI